MSFLALRMFFEGSWRAADKALEYLEKRMDASIQRAVKAEGKFIAKELKNNLRKGGSPKFKPITSFTRVIRKASGVSSKKPGISSGGILKAITSTKISKDTYFAGIMRGKGKHKNNSSMDIADVALAFELGRPPRLLELDKPSKRTGKTPRQWLWWLYLSGATKAPPTKRKTHIQISAAPARPFVEQVRKKQASLSTQRMIDAAIKDFKTLNLPGPVSRVPASGGSII